MPHEPPEDFDYRDRANWYLEDKNIRESYNMSISALEKQIAKKPKWNYEKVQKHMNKGVKAPYCPICEHDLLDDANDCYNYCTNCGQKLDWSD